MHKQVLAWRLAPQHGVAAGADTFWQLPPLFFALKIDESLLPPGPPWGEGEAWLGRSPDIPGRLEGNGFKGNKCLRSPEGQTSEQ